MNLSLILFLIGVLGFVLNRRNTILMLISIEIMLLAITFLILISTLRFDYILEGLYTIIYLVIIMLPLLGSISSGFFGRIIGITGSHIIACASVITTTILATVAFFEVMLLVAFYRLRGSIHIIVELCLIQV